MRPLMPVRALGSVLFALVAGSSAPVFGQLFREFPISPGSAPHGIAAGPDGALWFTEYAGNRIGRITTGGSVTEFTVPSGGPDHITAGPDGALWFTEPAGNMVGRITTAGLVDMFAVPTANSPVDITAGPDGALWFTEPGGDRIGRITTTGTFTEFLVPAFRPNAITAGPDGALWFTYTNGIGRITTAGVVTQFTFPLCGGSAAIAAGPDGALWFTETGSGRIGRITTAGVFAEFDGLGGNSDPHGISPGPDGALWFTDLGNNLVGRIATDPVVTNVFALPFSPAGPGQPRGIAAGPDAALWFTEEGRNRIGRIVTGAAGAPPPAGCAPNVTTLCLNGGRFQVQTLWSKSNGPKLPGQAVPLTGDTGYFWFLTSNNVEIVVKVVAGCAFNSRFWIFAGGLTDFNVAMTVTDMRTGAAKVYTNPEGTAFRPIQDTATFAECP